jgi:hypothetical protein
MSKKCGRRIEPHNPAGSSVLWISDFWFAGRASEFGFFLFKGHDLIFNVFGDNGPEIG